ncbi:MULTISPECIES: hypothetical protein [unclassified Neorhizobium]|uniref:hypothetical protein n=1 Tax=unclassified Neorhizobium TaxID=2629175 RepID=UPI001FF61DE7|nr:MULTISPECIES: hypothetical protein [unclassified Neorhizobium]MCJ9668509.1 hypothetical protein [Neorhizobium sp. SHOUNA12B]MCJ9743960.1 hypothetical protein [Neorhizobium sp. SHOUNA12A]
MSRDNALLKNRFRRLIHRSRALAISGLRCSLALRLFFIAQPKPVQKPPDRGSVDFYTALSQFNTQLVQGHFAMKRHAPADPFTMGRKLAARRMSLLAGGKRTG